MNTLKTEYAMSTTKKYWCHLCKRDFTKIYIESIGVQCSYCNKPFCEELEQTDVNSNSHPSHFELYESSTRHMNSHGVHFFSNNQPRTTSSLLDLIIHNLLLQQFDDDIESIIDQIMMNDPNKYGNPPASKESVNHLQTFEVSQSALDSLGIENSCSVCKDEFKLKDNCTSMPCHHSFHSDCLLPWLKERNSCPVCRFELPTDDEDFENRKKKNHNQNHT